MIKILRLSLIVFFLKLSFLKAEIVKPSIEINPVQVVKIQLDGLMKNDSPYKDKGIEQTWEFAHPNNKKFTGPLNKFKEMIKGESYKMLIDHENHEVKEIFLNNDSFVDVVDFFRTKKYLNNNKIYHHVGIYAFTNVALSKYVKLSRSKLEIARNLEQMRAMENNLIIKVALCSSNPLSVDTEQDLIKIRKEMN